MAWVIAVRSCADVPPGCAGAAAPPTCTGPAAPAGPGSSPVKSTLSVGAPPSPTVVVAPAGA
eukprot:3459305-Prymnesium_polylepis.1